MTPTLNGSRILAYLDADPHVGDAYLKYFGAGLKATYEGRVTRAAADDAAAVARRHDRFEKAARLLPLLQQSGVTILAGTDAGFLNSFNYPGIGLHDELEILVRYGLTPQQALAASVVHGPAFLGKAADFGAIAAGRVADVLLLERNPLEDIRATRTIHGLVLRGRHPRSGCPRSIAGRGRGARVDNRREALGSGRRVDGDHRGRHFRQDSRPRGIKEPCLRTR